MGVQEQFGLIYDAVAGVERAAYKVADSSVRTRWYAWLREVELTVCCEIAQLARREPGAQYRFARCRNQSTLAEWFVGSVEGGKYLVGDDPLRLARFMALAREFLALHPVPAHQCKALKDFCRSAASELESLLKPELDPAVQTYIRRVLTISREEAAGDPARNAGLGMPAS